MLPVGLARRGAHERVGKLAKGCVTRHHGHPYLGFARNQWELLQKKSPRRIKPLLYTYRVILTGIHLLRTGEMEANLPALNEIFRLDYIDDLIARKREGPEKGELPGGDLSFHAGEYGRLLATLEEARTSSTLPESASVRDELHELLIALRLGARRKASNRTRGPRLDRNGLAFSSLTRAEW